MQKNEDNVSAVLAVCAWAASFRLGVRFQRDIVDVICQNRTHIVELQAIRLRLAISTVDGVGRRAAKVVVAQHRPAQVDVRRRVVSGRVFVFDGEVARLPDAERSGCQDRGILSLDGEWHRYWWCG